MSASITPLLAHLWHKNQPMIRERLALLDRAAACPADQSLREEAISVAHKLAGSLAMFGFPAGTDLARTLEAGLEAETLSSEQQAELARQLRATLFPTTSLPS